MSPLNWLAGLSKPNGLPRSTRPRGRRAEKRNVPAMVTQLESRCLLSASTLESATSAPAAPVLVDEISPGAVILRTKVDIASLPAATSDGPVNLSGNGLQFNLVPAVGMSQQAIDGFQDAADLWSSVLRDDIMVNININFTALGPGILGSAGSTTQGNTLSEVKTALTTDAKSLTDATAVANLPAGSSWSLYVSDATTGDPELDNNNTGNNNVLDVNTANAKALGLLAANNATADASITFSNLFTWDFDRSNGITAGAFDFVGVAAHEIGHALGFVSGADVYDYYSGDGPGAPDENDPYRVGSVLDLFRYSADSLIAGADNDMRADLATKFFSIDGGVTQLTTFSTGSFNGDGNQASHWKDDLGIGIMDPTAAPAEYADITNLDVQAFDAMGWDVAMDLGDAPDTGAGTGNGNYQTNLSDNGPRHLLFSASGNIADPAGAPKVFLGASVTSELTALQNGTATGDTDNGVASFPTLQAGTSPNITVTSSGSGAKLNYFFDFNRDGDFSDAGESFSATLNSASQAVPVVIPAGASLGSTVARFRISTAGGLTAVGAANDGEVEDYLVTLTGAVNTAPQIGGALTNQPVNDNATIAPFSAFTVVDPDTQALSATVTVQNATVRGDLTAASTVGWNRSQVGNNFVYSRTFPSAVNNAGIVQAAIRSLVFQPRSNVLMPGVFETTAFSVSVSDGIATPVTNSTTTVRTTSVNDVPQLEDVLPLQINDDNLPTNPFAGVTVNDPDNQKMNAVVTIFNGVVRGDFTVASRAGWSRSTQGNNIIYSRFYSTRPNVGAEVQAAVRALVFQPRNNVLVPFTSELTDIKLYVTDGTANTQATTRLQTFSFNDAPEIGGTNSNVQVNDNATVNPFSAVTVTDPDFQDKLARITILNGAVRGDFTNAVSAGWTRSTLGNNIMYERFFGKTTNNGAVVQAAYRALTFQPRNNAIKPGTTEATDFQISVSDGVATPAVDTNTRVVTTSVNNLSAIGGTVANQTMNDNQTKLVLNTVTITDLDTQDLSVNVRIVNGPNRGDFTSASTVGWQRVVSGGDIVYVRYFSAAANIGSVAQAAIRTLVFQPRTNVPNGTTETTVFTVLVKDGTGGAVVSNSGASVITTGVAPLVAPAMIQEADISTVVLPTTIEKRALNPLARLLKKVR